MVDLVKVILRARPPKDRKSGVIKCAFYARQGSFLIVGRFMGVEHRIDGSRLGYLKREWSRVISVISQMNIIDPATEKRPNREAITLFFLLALYA